ncbi:unnamed protein product [Ceutorhynchus assimilis]|uniref:Regulatory protein zeste n=1 Tax=Ceutorhynchus assimilis TaxID=467358 RepID=A0A9N9MU55_9CUCU|nr:unnamed protein product [Ceutorhynchus assimilis]
MESGNKKSSGFVTKKQKELLVEFMNKHPDLLSRKFSNSFTWKDSRMLWEKAAAILNAVPGSVKNWEQWRKTWKDLQSRAKTKQGAFRKDLKRTGGGSRVPSPDLDPTEQAVLDTIPIVSIEGHNVLESDVVLFIDDENPSEATIKPELPLLLEFPFPTIALPSSSQDEYPVKSIPVPSTSQEKSTREIPTRISRKSAGKVLEHILGNAQKLGDIQERHYQTIEGIEERKAVALERLAAAKEQENTIRNRQASAMEKIAEILLSFISS